MAPESLPLPTGARQRWSPLDMSIATTLPQGGLNSGTRCGPATYEYEPT